MRCMVRVMIGNARISMAGYELKTLQVAFNFLFNCSGDLKIKFDWNSNRLELYLLNILIEF